jgi:hypothetical protein
MSSELERYHAAADFSGENARREFKSAIATSIAFGTASFIAYETIEHMLPESTFREAASHTVLALGGLAAGVTAAAGTLTAAMWRIDEMRYLRAEHKLRHDQSQQ